MNIEELAQQAENFLRSGLSNWGQWIGLTNEEKAAFIVAGNRLWAERAAMIGLASQGRFEAATIMSRVDGGLAMADILIERAMDRAQEKLKRVNE